MPTLHGWSDSKLYTRRRGAQWTLSTEHRTAPSQWSFQNLPIIPDEFQLKPIERTESRFKLLKRLMKRDDIDLIVNACDAGREGELI